jgi:hypothetical protein
MKKKKKKYHVYSRILIMYAMQFSLKKTPKAADS